MSHRSHALQPFIPKLPGGGEGCNFAIRNLIPHHRLSPLSLSLSISGAERWIVLAILCPSRSVLSWIWSLNVLKRISHHRSVLHTDTDTATRFKQVYICKTTKGRRGAGSLAHCGRQTVTWSVLLTSLTERIRKYKLKTGNTLRPAALLDTLVIFAHSDIKLHY